MGDRDGLGLYLYRLNLSTPDSTDKTKVVLFFFFLHSSNVCAQQIPTSKKKLTAHCDIGMVVHHEIII